MQCYMYHLLIPFSATTHCLHRLQLSIATAIHCNYVLLLLNLLWHCSATITLYIHCHFGGDLEMAGLTQHSSIQMCVIHGPPLDILVEQLVDKLVNEMLYCTVRCGQ